MIAKSTEKEPIIDWTPAPGYVLCTIMDRKEVAELYDRKIVGKTQLSMPDKMGRASDSVGVGQIIEKGQPDRAELLDLIKLIDYSAKELKDSSDMMTALSGAKASWLQYNVGDYIAFLPYTDQIIEIDGVKYSLVGYDKIRAVRKGDNK